MFAAESQGQCEGYGRWSPDVASRLTKAEQNFKNGMEDVRKMFYSPRMPKTITDNQLIGELGESAVRSRFLSFGFQFDVRSRLEAGIDAIAEIMIEGEPSAKMLAVQVKSTRAKKYASESESSFSYLLKAKDIEYWKNSNLPVIIVLYRESDQSYYWKGLDFSSAIENRQLTFNKAEDKLDKNAVDRLAALTVPKNGFGHYVPPLRDGETALVNLLPILLPKEIFVASTPFEFKKAIAELFEQDEATRFDWTIKGGTFWSFHDPREACTRAIVDLDQVEAIDTSLLAFHEDIDEQNNFAFLLRKTLDHQVQRDLAWDKERKLYYFRAFEQCQSRTFSYQSSKNRAKADVVNVVTHPKEPDKVSFVRHHAFIPKFECLMDQWYLMVSPTYHFTTNGFQRHSHPHGLLSGKKRLDNNASLRGQLIMWHRFLTDYENREVNLFGTEEDSETPVLRFEGLPEIELPTTVPDDVWGKPKNKPEEERDQTELFSHAV